MYKNSKEAREKRAELLQEMHTLHQNSKKEKRSLTEEEETRWDEMNREIDVIDRELPLLLVEEEKRKKDAGKLGTRVSGKSFDTPAGVWKDENGNEFREYRSNERICEDEPEVNIGSIARALVLGAKTENEKRALGEGTPGAGGYTVPTITAQSFIDLMRAKSRVSQAGASTVPLTSNNLTIAKVATDPVAEWRLENADVAESDPTFTAVQLAPKSLACYVRVSRELFADSLNIDTILNNILTQAMGNELDRVALLGSGTDPEPRGIKNTVGIGAIVMGENGAALTNYDKILDAYEDLYTDNSEGPTAAIIAPRTWRALAGLKATDNQPLVKPEAIKDLPFLQTSKVPIDDDQGTAENASSIYIGDFTKLVYGIRQDIRIELLKEAGWSKLQYIFLVHMRADLALYHTQSFIRIAGIIP